MAVEARPPQDVIHTKLSKATHRPLTLNEHSFALDALRTLVARVEQAERERDEAVEAARKSWDAAWTKARAEWQSNVTEKLPAAEAERDRLAAALRRVICDSPGTPDSVKQYLVRELEGAWGESYEHAVIARPPKGYIVPGGDERCDFVMDACICMKRKGHDGLHACAHGGWRTEPHA